MIYNFNILQNETEYSDFKNFVRKTHYSGIWHTKEWLNFQIKSNLAYDGLIFTVNNEENKILLAGVLQLRKKKFFKTGYIQAGIICENLDLDIYKAFLKGMKKISKEKQLTFIDMDFIKKSNENDKEIIFKNGNTKKIKLPIPQYTTMIKLSNNEDEILKNMKSKGRYNIKLAMKKGVIVKEAGIKDINSFYKLLVNTSKRDGFREHPKSHYENFLKTIPDSYLFLAEHDGEYISGAIMTYFNKQALYYYGASSNHKRNLMAPYLIQWAGIKKGKEHSCEFYDFMGIADPDDENDPLIGVTEFKMKFGGDVIEFLPGIRIIENKILYFSYTFLYNLKKIIKL